MFIDANGDIKLGDFGLARILHDTSLAKTFVGTPYYTSPVSIQPNNYTYTSSKGRDAWGHRELGIVDLFVGKVGVYVDLVGKGFCQYNMAPCHIHVPYIP